MKNTESKEIELERTNRLLAFAQTDEAREIWGDELTDEIIDIFERKIAGRFPYDQKDD